MVLNFLVDEEIGIIAQELQQISGLEKLVGGELQDEDGNDTPLDVNYNALLSVLIQAVKELSAEVALLKSRQ